METGKRSKNFTQREKMLLIEVAKDFVAVIDNKKTDGTTIEAKKQSWIALTNKYNAVSETGIRTEKQLHALYDNLKKKARKNISNDKSEIYKTGGGTFCPKTILIDEKVVALLSPQFRPLSNEFDLSAPYYNNLGIKTQVANEVDDTQDIQVVATQDTLVVLEDKENKLPKIQPTSTQVTTSTKRPISPLLRDLEITPKNKKMCLTETKKKYK